MISQYQLWLHRASGRVYAVHLVVPQRGSRQVVGVCGPLDPLAPSDEEELAGYPYQRDGAALAQVAAAEEFTIHLPRRF